MANSPTPKAANWLPLNAASWTALKPICAVVNEAICCVVSAANWLPDSPDSCTPVSCSKSVTVIWLSLAALNA